MKKEKKVTNCDMCQNYIYDEDDACYICQINLDEDEMYKFLSGSNFDCNYFQLDDDYKIVRKQN